MHRTVKLAEHEWNDFDCASKPIGTGIENLESCELQTTVFSMRERTEKRNSCVFFAIWMILHFIRYWIGGARYFSSSLFFSLDFFFRREMLRYRCNLGRSHQMSQMWKRKVWIFSLLALLVGIRLNWCELDRIFFLHPAASPLSAFRCNRVACDSETGSECLLHRLQRIRMFPIPKLAHRCLYRCLLLFFYL